MSFGQTWNPWLRYMELEQEYFNLGDKLNSVKAGLGFHRELAHCCPNGYLVNCVLSTLATTYAYLLLFEPERDSAGKRCPAEHQKLLDIMAARNLSESKLYLHKHILESFDSFFCLPIKELFWQWYGFFHTKKSRTE